MLTLLNALRHGGTRNTTGIWLSIEHLEEKKTGLNTGKW